MKMTHRHKDGHLLLASDYIARQPPQGDDLCFQHVVFCQIGLPRSELPGAHEYRRQQGAAWLVLQAGSIDMGSGPVAQGLPYGVWPRQILAWLNTYSIRHSTRVVPIGESPADFMRLLGKRATGGKRGGYQALGKQLPALASCRVQMGSLGRTYGGQPIEQFDAWMPSSQRCWQGELKLSQSYFSDLQASAVPLDQRAVDALSGSSLSLDAYSWLAYRLHRVGSRGQTISWRQVYEQFGSDYRGLRPENDFQKKFKRALRDALCVYPKARVEVSSGGLLLRSSPPPVNKLGM